MSDFVKPEPSIIKEKQKNGWLKAWFAIEVIAIRKDLAIDSIKKHIERMCKAKHILIVDVVYSEPIESKDIPAKIKDKLENDAKAYSVTAEVTFFCKSLSTLLELVMMYGPSAIEVLEPKAIVVNVDEAQNIANVISGMLHQFAAAGVGGMVISTDQSKK